MATTMATLYYPQKIVQPIKSQDIHQDVVTAKRALARALRLLRVFGRK